MKVPVYNSGQATFIYLSRISHIFLLFSPPKPVDACVEHDKGEAAYTDSTLDTERVPSQEA